MLKYAVNNHWYSLSSVFSRSSKTLTYVYNSETHNLIFGLQGMSDVYLLLAYLHFLNFYVQYAFFSKTFFKRKRRPICLAKLFSMSLSKHNM
jgi:hypothetical protein